MADITSPATPATATVSFNHPLSLKLDDHNFLLWGQQVGGVITAHKLHRYVVNPEIPPQYANQDDRALGRETDAYQPWLVQDQMLFTWLLLSLSDSILP